MAGTGRISLSYSKVGDIRETHQYNVTATFEIGFNYGGYNSAAKSWSMSCDGQSRSGASSFSVPNGNGSWRYTTITTQTFTVTMNKSGESKTVTVSAYMETGVSPSSISANNSITLPAVTWLFDVAYNSNGGSGSMSTDTVSYGSNYKTKANTFSRDGYTFTGWNEASNGSKADWTSYIGKDWKWTYTNSITLYAQWRLNTYTISYNANGGSGAPASQTKTHGQNLTLSSTKPIKTNYNFLGWSTNQNASVPEYSAGGVCSINANTTLYAVWELAYWAPKITNVFVHRCTDTGVDYGEGTYAMVEFRWECCQIVGVNNVRSIVVEGETISASGTNGNVNAIVGGNYSIDNGYVLNINVTDSKGGASTYQIYLESTAFTIDFKAGGKGVAFGMPANEDGFHVDFPAHFYQAIKCYASIQSEDGTISGHSIIGDDIYSYGDITANGNLTYTQKVLWSGIWHGGWAQAAGEAIFSEPVSIQHSGIVLVFQEYNPSTQKVSGTNINSFFVSKQQIALLSGAGINFTFAQWFGDQFVSKYLYINDTKITGNVNNATDSFTRNGVTFCNNRTVLTKVIGV